MTECRVLVGNELTDTAGHQVQLGAGETVWTVGGDNGDLISDNSASKYHRHQTYKHINDNQLSQHHCQMIGSDQYSCII